MFGLLDQLFTMVDQEVYKQYEKQGKKQTLFIVGFKLRKYFTQI